MGIPIPPAIPRELLPTLSQEQRRALADAGSLEDQLRSAKHIRNATDLAERELNWEVDHQAFNQGIMTDPPATVNQHCEPVAAPKVNSAAENEAPTADNAEADESIQEPEEDRILEIYSSTDFKRKTSNKTHVDLYRRVLKDLKAGISLGTIPAEAASFVSFESSRPTS